MSREEAPAREDFKIVSYPLSNSTPPITCQKDDFPVVLMLRQKWRGLQAGLPQ